MHILQIIFCLSLSLVFWAYLGYPLLMAAAARLLGRPTLRRPGRRPSVSIVLAAYNEQPIIGRRLRELARLLDAGGIDGQIIVVSDGSTDETADLARAGDRAIVIESPRRYGKASAINLGCTTATGEIMVLADVRQTWASDALDRLLENFADPTVGAVSGDLVLQADGGIMDGVGLYWRFEKWLRKNESRVHSTVGVTGAICAVRRNLYCLMAPGTILDDVCWPLDVVMAGYRVVHDHSAKAFDRLPAGAGDEFRRKTRTQAGVWQWLARRPVVFLPWRNPLWFQVVCHKAIRLAAPWAMLAMLLSSAMLPGLTWRTIFILQIAFYLLAAAPFVARFSLRPRLASASSSFVLLNAAVWLGFWVWIFGRGDLAWKKASYHPHPQDEMENLVQEGAA